jgi:hypothetical protein
MTKQQNSYAPHDADNLNDGWDAVEEYLNDAVLIAFDSCHKIYLAMDEEEAQFFRSNYQPLVIENQTPSEMLETVHGWWDESCELRFVNAVWHNEADPNDGFVTLISQMAEENSYDDEDDEEN